MGTLFTLLALTTRAEEKPFEYWVEKYKVREYEQGIPPEVWEEMVKEQLGFEGFTLEQINQVLATHDVDWDDVWDMFEHNFKMADIDNSGTLTEEEGRALYNYKNRPNLPEKVDWMQVFKYSDFNEDERMSEDELVSVMLKHGWDFGSIEQSVERQKLFAGTPAGMNYDEFEAYMKSWGHKNIYSKDYKEEHDEVAEIKITEDPENPEVSLITFDGAKELAISSVSFAAIILSSW